MADLSYYAAKITECLRLLESSTDPLYRDVYQAMADEFAEKYDALKRRMLEGAAQPVPVSPLLVPQLPPVLPDLPPQPVVGLAPKPPDDLALTRSDPPGRVPPPA